MTQQISSTAFERAPRLIDIGDGHRIAVEVSGHGPTVVLEAGGPGYGIDLWGDFPSRLSEFATVVVYDRLGVGYSEAWRLTSPTLAEHAENLTRLLDRLPVAQPVLLVGWSMGGLMAQNFAARHPERIAGLLLLDPTMLVKDQYAQMSALRRWLLPKLTKFVSQRTARSVRKWAVGKNLRAKARLVRTLASSFGPRMEERTSAKLLELFTTRADVQIAMASLAQGLFRTTAEVARTVAERGLPDVPVTLVLSGYLPANTPKATRALLGQMRAEHEAIAAARGFELRKLPDVSHQIPLEAPEDCVHAARELLSRISGARAAPSPAPSVSTSNQRAEK